MLTGIIETAYQQELWKLHANKNYGNCMPTGTYGNCMSTGIMETACQQELWKLHANSNYGNCMPTWRTENYMPTRGKRNYADRKNAKIAE